MFNSQLMQWFRKLFFLTVKSFYISFFIPRALDHLCDLWLTLIGVVNTGFTLLVWVYCYNFPFLFYTECFSNLSKKSVFKRQKGILLYPLIILTKLILCRSLGLCSIYLSFYHIHIAHPGLVYFAKRVDAFYFNLTYLSAHL